MSSAKTMERVLEEKQYVLECVEGMGENSRPLYAHVLMKKSRLPHFRAALATGDVDVAKFGLVVSYGYDSQPPAGLEEELLAYLTQKEP